MANETENPYLFTNNPTVSGVSICNTDILNDNIMYLKWEADNNKGSGTSLPLFTPVIQDHILSFEESKGYALQGTYVYKESAPERYGYPDFYAKCIEEKNAGTETQTTLGETTITTYNNANGHIFYDIADKDIVDAYFASTGIAWFYGIDEENERVFLPRNNWFMQVTTDTSKVGQYIEAGLPNIEGEMITSQDKDTNTGCVKRVSTDGWGTTSSGRTRYWNRIDASGSSEIYGKSDTVQPASVVNALYIVVGNNEQKSAITDVTEITTSENDTLPLFTGMYFDFSPNNPSWLKAGEQVNSGGIYTSCYNTLVNCLEGINPYNIMVVDVTNLEADIDYSEYWKVNQDEMWFKTPLSLSHKALTAGVKGNGNTIGLNNGSDDLFLINTNNNGGYGILQPRKNSGLIAGSADIGIVYTTSQTIGLNTIAEKTGIVVQESTAQLYFKVANAVQNLEIIDVGKILEALADKISRQDCATYVTETYNDGLSWYRIWSPDHTGKRYYEEGGFVNTGTGKMNISFFFEFDSTPSIVGGIYSSSTNTPNFNSIAIADTNLSTTGFTIQRSGSAAKFWEVKGYLKD